MSEEAVALTAGQLAMIEDLQREEAELVERVRGAAQEKMDLAVKAILAGHDITGSVNVVGLEKDPPALRIERNG